MGKAEERGWVDCTVVCEESLIWFEGMPVVVGYESMAAGILCLLYILRLAYKDMMDRLHGNCLTKFR